MGTKYKQMTHEACYKLKELLDTGKSTKKIAEEMGCHYSTIYREIKFGTINGVYDPNYAYEKHQNNKMNCGRNAIISKNSKLAREISDYILVNHYNLKKIEKLLKEREKEFGEVPAYSTLYNAVENGIIPNVVREDLRSCETRVFNNGNICIAKWVREELDIQDGDVLYFEVTEEGKLVFSKNKFMNDGKI